MCFEGRIDGYWVYIVVLVLVVILGYNRGIVCNRLFVYYCSLKFVVKDN